MRNKSILVLMSMLLLWGCGQSAFNGNPFSEKSLDKLIGEGQYAEAAKMIRIGLTADTLTEIRRYDLNSKLEIMDRIRKDFTKVDTAVLSYIKQYHPEVSAEEIAQWEASGALECKIIDGEKRYFKNAPRNLFRISKQAQSYMDQIRGRQSDNLDTFLAGYIPQVVKEAREQGNRTSPAGVPYSHLVQPVKMKIRYTLTVNPNEVPDGEIIRVWLPYPRSSSRHSDIRLLATSQDEYIISPESYPHRSIYMERPAEKDKPAVFSYELSYTSSNQWFDFKPEDIRPYDTQSELYKKYTSERKTHVIFTPRIKELTDSIVGDEQNPYLKAKKIFSYIADNYPWASAREYSTLENIPQYVLENKHGDCGQVSLLFITMARYAGVPAKWQSGWMMHPGEVNLHDWAEVYYEGIGWVPVDQSFGYVQSDDPDTHYFYTKGLDAYRYIVNDDFSGNFYPAKIYPRSETVDFQRGEVEWKAGNLYFDRWDYNMEVEYE